MTGEVAAHPGVAVWGLRSKSGLRGHSLGKEELVQAFQLREGPVAELMPEPDLRGGGGS